MIFSAGAPLLFAQGIVDVTQLVGWRRSSHALWSKIEKVPQSFLRLSFLTSFVSSERRDNLGRGSGPILAPTSRRFDAARVFWTCTEKTWVLFWRSSCAICLTRRDPVRWTGGGISREIRKGPCPSRCAPRKPFIKEEKINGSLRTSMRVYGLPCSSERRMLAWSEAY